MRTFTFSTTTFPSLNLLWALALLPAAAHAEAAAPGDDEIIVTANRTEQHLSETGKSITVIGVTQIEQRQNVSVADLLRSTPGVTLSRNGGAGTLTSIFIRGAQSEQTVALIDGVKLNDPSSPAGGFNFADLLTDNIERIEILRGPQSVLWGSQAIGGVVNLITHQPTEHLALRASGEYGSHNEGHLTGTVSGTTGPLALSAGAGYLSTDGISVADAALGNKERDGYHLFGANAKAVVTISDAVSADLRGFYTKSKVDLDGFAFTPPYLPTDDSEYQRQEQVVGYAGLNAALFGGRLKNRLAVEYALIDRSIYDPTQTPSKTSSGRGRNVRYEYQGIADLTGWARATFGAEHQRETYHNFDTFDGPTRAHATTNSVYGDLHLKPLDGLNLGGGVRYDHHDVFGHATTAGADISYSPNQGATRLKASYGEGFKAPSLYQLYGPFGDKTLQPERAHGFDAGIVQRLFGRRVELSATWFTRKVRDEIDFDLTSFTYGNIARVRSEGVELEALVRPVDGLTIDANYTYAKSTNREPTDPNFGKDLQRRPRNSFNIAADYDWAFGLSTGATVTRVSHSFDDTANLNRLKGYTLVDLRAAYPVTANIEIYGRIENLFDKIYETARGYGQERRTVHGGVRLRY
jgi:vitamin B12 transporter